MFTGIIKKFGEVVDVQVSGKNKTFTIESELAQELTIDQSVAHNGICLTVVAIFFKKNQYQVTAIEETLSITSSQNWKKGTKINLETAARLNAFLDGHIVQGHVDTVGHIKQIEPESGSYRVTIEFPSKFAGLVISKGSICIDGVSLTVIEPTNNSFQVAIIPYTWEQTIFHTYQIGSMVNLEFDLIGKYILRNHQLNQHI